MMMRFVLLHLLPLSLSLLQLQLLLLCCFLLPMFSNSFVLQSDITIVLSSSRSWQQQQQQHGRPSSREYRYRYSCAGHDLSQSQQQQQQHQHDDDSSDSDSSSASDMVVIFGRPGAGKTTIADQVVQQLQQQQEQEEDVPLSLELAVLGLDLDVCVTQVMRDNFAQGIYPSLEERLEFAREACNHVQREIDQALASLQQQQQQQQQQDIVDTEHVNAPSASSLSSSSLPRRRANLLCVVSFSFVNTDLRDVYRQCFPFAKWILIDTTEDEANVRIRQRQGHFYKQQQQQQQQQKKERNERNNNNKDLSTEASTQIDTNMDDKSDEWKFAPVDFDHIVLDGNDSIQHNVDNIIRIVRNNMPLKK
jgi:AAA domain